MTLNMKLFTRLFIFFTIVLIIPIVILGIMVRPPITTLLLAGAISLGTGAVFAIVFAKNLLSPLGEMNRMVESIKNKDITARFESRGRDELSHMGRSVSSMVQGVHDTMRELNNIISSTTSSTEQMLQISNDQSKWVSEQSSYFLEISSTMEELNTSAQMVHQKADHLYKQAEDALNKSTEGQEALKNATEFMNNIREKVKEIAHRIMSLSEQAQAIDQIISTVSDIAEKTDILAINAAIEAVKAGEYGKGFGVVAVEIRKLADQSKKASAKIVSRVREIQAATNNSVMAAEEGEKSVDRGVQLIDQAGDTVIDAMTTFQETVNLGNEIRLASREQSVATSQVAEGTQVISQSVQKMDTSFKETVQSIKFLSEQTQKINRLLADYKL